MRNNNREIIRLLARESYRQNRGRNCILISAVAFVVIMLFGVFSLSIGKIEADYLLYVRNTGTAAYTTLERPTQEQIEIIENLSYIKGTGKVIYLGNSDAFSCQVLDQEAYKNMQLPAYTDVHGTYPQEEDEIMLPMRALLDLGIRNPKVNMDIPVKMDLVNGKTFQKKFRLSGYYTEYVDPGVSPPRGFFSRRFLDTLDIDTELNSILLIQQNDTLKDEYAEEKLYQDVPMRDDAQQFFGGNAISYQTVYDMAGGFDTAIGLTLVILIGAFLLLHNVLQISFNRDIRQYGLLKTLGTTKGQLRRIAFRQVIRTILWGCSIGAAAGCAMTLVIVPKLLSRMYLHGLGSASAMIAFKPGILIFAVIFGGGITLASAGAAMRKAVKMSPVEAAKFTEPVSGNKRKERQKTSGGSMVSMAWRNIFRFRKRFIITVLSLSLGITVALGSVVLSKGTDHTNKINYENNDFSLMTAMDAGGSFQSADEVFFGSELKEKIEGLEGIQEKEIVHGGYGRAFSDAKALLPRTAPWKIKKRTKIPFVVQALDDDILKEIRTFVKKENLTVDVDKVIAGDGFIVLHYHNLSKILEERSKKTLGIPMDIYNLTGDKTARLECSGYMDFTRRGFPKFKTTWNGGSILYLLASEEGFQKMKLTEQTFGIELNVDPKRETMLKQQINALVTEYNRETTKEKKIEANVIDQSMILFNAKSDTLESAKNYIASSRLVMGALCGILLIMGLVNYTNVTVVGLTTRRKEFAVLESIGLTRRQLRKMLLMEGMFYSLVVSAVIIIFGSGALFALKWIMSQRMAYFVFRYPWIWLASCIFILLVICTCVPLLMYKKAEKESIIERLRDYAD